MCRFCLSSLLFSLTSAAMADELPVLLQEDFENGRQRWQTTDDNFWKIDQMERDGKTIHVLRCTGKSDYQPPVRSPHTIALLKDLIVGDFELTATVQNTNYNAGAHRDLCLFWGYQDPSHFYYVHFGAKADPHACQIFIVDGKPRKMITVDQAEGTPWTRGWHKLRVVRRVAEGSVKVYFDDMEKPMMTAQDTTFVWGQIGVGTFDDNGNFDDVELRGVKLKRPAD